MAHEIVQAAVQLNDKSVQPFFITIPTVVVSPLRTNCIRNSQTLELDASPAPCSHHCPLPPFADRAARTAIQHALMRTPPIRTYLNFVRNRARVPLCGTRSASDWTWVARRAPTAARTLQTMMPHPPVTLNPICSLLTYSLPQARLISRGWLSSCSSDWTYRF